MDRDREMGIYYIGCWKGEVELYLIDRVYGELGLSQDPVSYSVVFAKFEDRHTPRVVTIYLA
jgi:hypothetical protein